MEPQLGYAPRTENYKFPILLIKLSRQMALQTGLEPVILDYFTTLVSYCGLDFVFILL